MHKIKPPSTRARWFLAPHPALGGRISLLLLVYRDIKVFDFLFLLVVCIIVKYGLTYNTVRFCRVLIAGRCNGLESENFIFADFVFSFGLRRCVLSGHVAQEPNNHANHQEKANATCNQEPGDLIECCTKTTDTTKSGDDQESYANAPREGVPVVDVIVFHKSLPPNKILIK